jgi:hypothetical protein
VSPYRRVDRDLRREGLRSFRLGLAGLKHNQRNAERLLRSSLHDLVEAFLEDRQRNADLFALAHRIGLILVQTFKCPYEWREADRRWYQDCAVLALHRRIAFSVAWFWARRCTICGANEFDCVHVPGESYDGQVCEFERDKAIGIEHVALTSNPDFTHTFMQSDQATERDVLEQFGRPLGHSESLFCNHCRNCRGYFGPDEDDLDPSRWTIMDEIAREASERGSTET